MLVRRTRTSASEAASAAQLGVDRLPLLARLVRLFEASGLTVTTRSDSPAGAGIAGSSAMNIAITKALSVWTGRWTSDAEILLTAMNVEAQVIHVPTGAQDYRPALYGGVSAVELDATGVRRVKLDVPAAALAARIVVAYTGASRNSGINNWDVMKRRIDGDPAVIAAFDGIRDAAAACARPVRARLGPRPAVSWMPSGTPTALAPGVTTPEINALLAPPGLLALSAAKSVGQGGGGVVLPGAAGPQGLGQRRADGGGAQCSTGHR